MPTLSFASSVCPVCVWPPERGFKDIKGRGVGSGIMHMGQFCYSMDWSG